MTTDDTLKAIKKELRANMNGVASKFMRENGLGYHVNWGIELPRLQSIAHEFAPDHQLAQALWHENVRESKILATMLMPTDSFDHELANIWVDQIPTPEIAQMAAMHLFCRIRSAASLAFEWIANENDTRQLCGYLILARLLQQGAELNERSVEELKDQIGAIPATAPLALRKVAASLTLMLE